MWPYPHAFVSTNISPLYNGEIVISQHKEKKRAILISPILATCLVCFVLRLGISKANCSFLEKIFSKIVTNSESTCLLLI